MLITHTLLVFYTPRHSPNYPAANDSVWKVQNKCIPARKVKKDKLQMNQNSNSQGNFLVLLIRYFFPKKIGCLSSEDSTFTQEDIQAVWSHHPGILFTVLLHQHGRFLCVGLLPEHLQCFFIRMPKDPSPTLHRFLNFFWHGGPVSSTPLEIPS